MSAADGQQPAVLEARGLTVRFGAVTALSGVSFTLRRGEIHALCGENGAGKSTLIKTLSGVHPHSVVEGDILVDGQVVQFTGLRDAAAAGIGVIHQELALVEEMTVAENIFLGREPRRGWLVDHDRMRVEAGRLLERFGIAMDPGATVASLGIGQKQLVEIVKALGRESRILILDEPTAALAEAEVEVLLHILEGLRAAGVSMIYISHRLGEVQQLADRITVLRDGAAVVTMNARDTDIPGIIRHMVGREITDLFPRERPALSGEVLLRVEDLSAAAAPQAGALLQGISLEVRAGEVLGIGGLMGAGRTELLRHLFGAWGVRRCGRVTLCGSDYAEASPQVSIARGLVIVTEDRKRSGIHAAQSIGWNLSLASLRQLTRHGLVDRLAEQRAGQALFDSLLIKAPGLETLTGGLSGGNQQKAVLGKALMTEPRVLLLDEPTRGIDVGAKREIYQLINRLTAAGKAVMLVSSELPELMGMSDRILMLHQGRASSVFSPGDYSQEALMAAAMGQAAAA
jgi:D-xylose transport system ATP-binding protein